MSCTTPLQWLTRVKLEDKFLRETLHISKVIIMITYVMGVNGVDNILETPFSIMQSSTTQPPTMSSAINQVQLSP